MTREEYGEMYKIYFPETVRYIQRRGRLYQAEAEEQAERSWVTGLEKLEQLKDPSKIVRWINKISLHFYISQKRRRSEVEFLASGGDNFIKPDFYLSLDSSKCIETVDKISRTALRDKAILSMYYFEGFEVSEIAQVVGLSDSGVKILLMRLRLKINCKLKRKTYKRQA